MCDFVSWIEKNGNLYYLTDKEIFSPEGEIKLAECQDNDYIGHGAIDKFYGLRRTGTRREVRDFWKRGVLPAELSKKIKRFDKWWGRTFKRYFQNDDLRYIIAHASPKWREKAWTQLLKQKPGNNDLRYIIQYASPKWREKAAQQLLKQKPDNYDLRCIIQYASPKWREKAQKELDKRQKRRSKE